MKSNGWSTARSPAFDWYKSFGHNDLTVKHCYFRYSRPPNAKGIKISDKGDQTAKYCSFYLNVCNLFNFIKNFDPINIKSLWAPEILMSCSECHQNQNFYTYQLSKAGGFGCSFWFHIFSNKAFLVLGHFFFMPGVFWFRLLV